jgi:hypothetical protein
VYNLCKDVETKVANFLKSLICWRKNQTVPRFGKLLEMLNSKKIDFGIVHTSAVCTALKSPSYLIRVMEAPTKMYFEVHLITRTKAFPLLLLNLQRMAGKKD